MSLSQNPLLGPMRKSMGNFTMYSYHGMNIVRTKAFKINDPKTEKQLNMRARMSPLSEMYRRFSSMITLGFPERDERKSPQNMFVSANFTTAFVMEDKTPVISYLYSAVSKDEPFRTYNNQYLFIHLKLYYYELITKPPIGTHAQIDG